MKSKLKGLPKNEASGQFPESGAIFMTSCATLEECLQRKIFALPTSFADFVREVKPGMALFVFEYEKRKLYGVFEAASAGKMDIVPHAFLSSGQQFPAQVRFTRLWNCCPLSENEFSGPIKENYYTRNKFNLGLSRDQVKGLINLFQRKVDNANIQDLTCEKELHIKKRHRIEVEEMELQSPISRRKLPCENSDMGAFMCCSSGHESAMSSFGVGSQSCIYREEEPEYLHYSEYLRTGPENSLTMSLPSHISCYSEPFLYRGEPESSKHSYEHLRNDIGNFIPASFTVNEPSIYMEEPLNLRHSSEDLRQVRPNLGDLVPTSLTFNQPRIYGEEPVKLMHYSEDLRTNLGDYFSSSFNNTVLDYNGDNCGVSVVERPGVFDRLGKVSEPRQDNSVFKRLQWVNGKHNKKTRKVKQTVLATDDDCMVDNSVETRSDMLHENDLRSKLKREPVVSTWKREYEEHFEKGIQMSEMPNGGDSTGERECKHCLEKKRKESLVSTWKHEYEEHFKKGGQVGEMVKRRDPTEERDTRDGLKKFTREPVVSVWKRESDDHINKGVQKGEMVKRRDPSKERDSRDGLKTFTREPFVSVWKRENDDHIKKDFQKGEMLKKREERGSRDCLKTFTREPSVSVWKRENVDNIKKGVQKGEILKRRDPTEETDCRGGSKESKSEPVVSIEKCENEGHFKKIVQKTEMLKRSDPTEERDCREGSNSLKSEPVVSILKHGNEERIKKAVQMGEFPKRRDPTGERDSRDGSKSNETSKHRPRRKLIRPSFYTSAQVQTFGSTNCVKQMPCQESSAGKENNENCEETSKTNITDCEKEVRSAICPSGCKGDNLNDQELKLGGEVGDRFNYAVQTNYEKEVPSSTCPSYCKGDNLTNHDLKEVGENFVDRFNSGSGTDFEKEVPPATCASHPDSDNLTEHEQKTGEDTGGMFNSIVEKDTKTLKTYKRRPKSS